MEDLITKRQALNQLIFWSGILFYFIFQVFSITDFLDFRICMAIQGVGLMLIIYGAINIFKFKIESSYLAILYTAYLLWLFFIVARNGSALLSYSSLKYFLFTPGGLGGMIYFLPLILLLPKDMLTFSKLVQVILISGIVYLALDLLFLRQLISPSDDPKSQAIIEYISALSLPSGFLLLTYLYHANKKVLLATGIILITLFLAVIRARRGLTLITLSIVMFAYFIFLFKTRKKYIVIYFSLLAVLLAGLYLSGVYKLSNNRIFGSIIERGDEDTRSKVELYFYDDMKTKDWIIGRGINGEYFCPDIEEDLPTNYRNVIETGYLQIILKGGIISLGLLLFITVPATIKGIFFSKNLLSKASGIWILLFLISLYPRDPVKFDLTYSIVWISVGICYSKGIRNMSDDSISEYFNLKN